MVSSRISRRRLIMSHHGKAFAIASIGIFAGVVAVSSNAALRGF